MAIGFFVDNITVQICLAAMLRQTRRIEMKPRKYFSLLAGVAY